MTTVYHDQLKFTLSQNIAELTDSNAHFEIIYKSLAPAQNIKNGHFSFNTFQLAKLLGKNPVQLSTELASKIPYAKSAGPYLNFIFDGKFLGETILNEMLQLKYFQKKITSNTAKTMVEYSQPNTHKELHVGHMRNLCLGDALIRIHKYAGFNIISSTFPGDVGTHVAKCLWYYKNFTSEQERTANQKNGAWLGQLYSKGNNLLEDQRGTPQEEKNRTELTAILHQLEKKSGEYYDLWKETRQWSVELMQKVYAWADVKFDQWYWESEVDSASVELVKKYYEQGLFIKDQGAIGIDLGEGLGFCLLIKSDGNGLYATKDIELARRKFENFKIEKSIYIVDKRQALHFKQVFAILEKMGFENAKNCYHLQYDFVELPDGAMSSRKGNIVPLQKLIDEMENHIKKEYLQKYASDWEQNEINQTASDIAKAAIKFGMNKIDPNKKIVFDMKDWLKLDGESGPYIQYVYARINSLFQKQNFSKTTAHQFAWSYLKEDVELELIIKLNDFNNVVESAVHQYKTSYLTAYLYDLCKIFNQFYLNCPIGTLENKEHKNARFGLCLATTLIIEKGLELLGIKTVQRM
jgi:arginyl-tRNA synthetase